MRQVTGSNPHRAANKFSVRLMSGGDPFIMERLEGALLGLRSGGVDGEDEMVDRLCVELFSKRMILIPSEMLSGEEETADVVARRELRAVGIELHPWEEILHVVPSDGGAEISALVVVPMALVEELDRRARVVNYSVAILRERVVSDVAHLCVDFMEGITTIKYFGERELLFADIYETESTADVIYWVDSVATAMRLEPTIPIYISRGNETLRRMLGRRFKKVMICE